MPGLCLQSERRCWYSVSFLALHHGIWFSALTGKGATFCFVAAIGTASRYINGGGGTFTFVVVGAFLCFAVDVDLFAAAVFGTAVLHGCSCTVAETATACFISTVCVVTGDLDITARTEFVVVVNTFCCRTVQNSHVCNLLIDQIKWHNHKDPCKK